LHKSILMSFSNLLKTKNFYNKSIGEPKEIIDVRANSRSLSAEYCLRQTLINLKNYPWVN
ncbi:MAG: hypothetical protein AAF383_05810, partial [Cyanobacteria bacterium P01_A01_bin.83]